MRAIRVGVMCGGIDTRAQGWGYIWEKSQSRMPGVAESQVRASFGMSSYPTLIYLSATDVNLVRAVDASGAVVNYRMFISVQRALREFEMTVAARVPELTRKPWSAMHMSTNPFGIPPQNAISWKSSGMANLRVAELFSETYK